MRAARASLWPSAQRSSSGTTKTPSSGRPWTNWIPKQSYGGEWRNTQQLLRKTRVTKLNLLGYISRIIAVHSFMYVEIIQN
uniref:Uncharacterized protein n=1 Tax=Arundo donax TaxID=35708 RepID=A0A0A9B4Q5_ARUDO